MFYNLFDVSADWSCPEVKIFNIYLLSNMISNFTESYTLASDEPEPEPEPGPEPIISSSEGAGENMAGRGNRPGQLSS